MRRALGFKLESWGLRLMSFVRFCEDRFGERPGETGRQQSRNRAPGPLDRAALPLPAQTLSYVAGIIRRHRARIGLCWRRLNPGRQALLVLVHLRETFADLAAGSAVGTATAWRYARETTTLLAVRAPKLRGALAAARKAGHAFVVTDGTLIAIDRVAADQPFYSGKHRRHEMNLQVISCPRGEILWVSGPLAGAFRDLTAARIWGILRKLRCCP